PPEEALAVVDELLAAEPSNAWAWREKALILRRLHRAADALAAAETAQEIEPSSPFSPGVRGLALVALGRDDEARAAFETALRRSIGCGYMDDLVNAAGDFAGRKASVAFLQAELARQPAPDAGAFLRFRPIARAVLSPDELRTALEA